MFRDGVTVKILTNFASHGNYRRPWMNLSIEVKFLRSRLWMNEAVAELSHIKFVAALSQTPCLAPSKSALRDKTDDVSGKHSKRAS